jgi:chemotaxis protein CheD
MIRNSEPGSLIKVGMAQYRVATAPAKMVTLSLGSCLGIVLYDPVSRVGALAHVMHPSREKVRNNANRAKFVDTAIDLMLGRMAKKGARRSRIQAKVFGGARMFGSMRQSPGLVQIGDDNITAARAELDRRNIPIIAESTGGSMGRTVLFDVSDGSVLIKDAYNNEELY